MVLSYQTCWVEKEKRPVLRLALCAKTGTGLNIQVAHAARMGLDETFAWINRITHEHVKGPVRFGSIFHCNEEQGAILRVHGGVP